jgi:hypothetical protein
VDSDPDPAVRQLTLKKSFSAFYFFKVHFSKIKRPKKSRSSKNQGFSYFFCLMKEGSGSISLTSGSGIREAQKHVDRVDPDPDSEHCF